MRIIVKLARRPCRPAALPVPYSGQFAPEARPVRLNCRLDDANCPGFGTGAGGPTSTTGGAGVPHTSTTGHNPRRTHWLGSRCYVVNRFRVPEAEAGAFRRRPRAGALDARQGQGLPHRHDRTQRRRPHAVGAEHHLGERRFLPPRAVVVRREAPRGGRAGQGDRRAQRLRGGRARDRAEYRVAPVVRLIPPTETRPAASRPA